MFPEEQSNRQYMVDEDIKNKRAFKLNAANLEFLKALARDQAGIKLDSSKESTVYNRLVRRLRTLNVSDFTEYCSLLEQDYDERIKFVNLISNNLTSFFREKYHFEFLEYKLLPLLFTENKHIRIWSAGCSSGEEAYSIAMIVNKVMKNRKDLDVKILATDINTDSLEKATAGIYEIGQTTRLTPEIRKYFSKGTGDNEGLVKINENIQKLVTFRYLNLIEKWPMHNKFDIIFCRNVLIYISKEFSKEILNNFSNYLVPGGHLFLGHAESSFHMPKYYTPLGRTMYQKSPTPEE